MWATRQRASSRPRSSSLSRRWLPSTDLSPRRLSGSKTVARGTQGWRSSSEDLVTTDQLKAAMGSQQGPWDRHRNINNDNERGFKMARKKGQEIPLQWRTPD